jgi:hypothetical protein
MASINCIAIPGVEDVGTVHVDKIRGEYWQDRGEYYKIGVNIDKNRGEY